MKSLINTSLFIVRFLLSWSKACRQAFTNAPNTLSNSSSSASLVAQLVTKRQIISSSLFLSQISNATSFDSASYREGERITNCWLVGESYAISTPCFVKMLRMRAAMLMACCATLNYSPSVNSVSNCMPSILPFASSAPWRFTFVKKYFGAFMLEKTTASPIIAPTFVPPM